MNGMLLVAGRGQRMEPLSSFWPKAALPVAGKPLAAFALGHLLPYCRRVVANLHRHPEKVAAALRAQSPALLFSFEPQLLGPAGGIAAARPLLGSGPVLVANGDVLWEGSLEPLAACGGKEGVFLGLLPHPDPGRWPSVILEGDGRVAAFAPPGEKPRGTPFLFTGFQLLSPQALAALPPPPSEMHPFWEAMRQEGLLWGVVLEGHFWEAGSPRAYWRAVMEKLQGERFIHPQALCHPRAAVEGSAIEGGGVVEEGALVEESVVLPGSWVRQGARLQRAVVGGEVAAGDEVVNELHLPGVRVPLS